MEQVKKDIISRFLETYKPSDNLIKPDEELLAWAKKILPEPLIELWVNYGFGDYGDGLIKVIDPRDYMDSLYEWLGKKDLTRVPIMITAFGDIFYYRKLTETEDDVSLLNIHYGEILVCSYSYSGFFNGFIINEKVKKELLREKLFYESIEKLGKLSYKECFFFGPALVIGGGEEIKYVQKGDAFTHQHLLLTFRK